MNYKDYVTAFCLLSDAEIDHLISNNITYKQIANYTAKVENGVPHEDAYFSMIAGSSVTRVPLPPYSQIPVKSGECLFGEYGDIPF